MSDSPDFSGNTLRWMKSVSAGHRKKYGQFMTPKQLRERLLDQCELWPGVKVLDPSVGTGEFLKAVLKREPEAEVHGWDIDPQVLKVATESAPEAILEQRNALDPWLGDMFDLIVGNPPYFQMRTSREIDARFGQVISGRANIFSLFFKVGLDVLKNGGRLAYVVPPSMNAGAYFNRLREYIISVSDIEFLQICADQTLFEDARTSVQLLVLRRGVPNSGRFTHKISSDTNDFSRTIFSENPQKLAAPFTSCRSLYSLGYEAVTGTIAWDQYRQHLRRTASCSTVPLISSHNITDEGLCLSESHKRPQYIEPQSRPLTGTALVMNRVVGAVGAGELRCAMIPEGWKFLGENHVNVIKPHEHFRRNVDWHNLMERLKAPEILSRVRNLTGNTQISAKELTHLIPI